MTSVIFEKNVFNENFDENFNDHWILCLHHWSPFSPGSEEALISFPMETFIPLLAEASVKDLDPP